LIALLVLAAAPAARAADFVGPNDCTSCHDHDKQTKAYETSKHYRSLDIFETPKATEFINKLGLKDPYSDFCTGCHATMVEGFADYGVSCESCHGGAKDYLKPHQTKGAYEQAISLGMLRTKDLAVRAKNCVSCHIVSDKRILNIGHPDGTKFDIVKFSDQIKHWEETHSPAEIAAAGEAAIKAKGGVAVAKSSPPPAPAPEPAPAKPSAPPPSQPPQATAEPAPAKPEPKQVAAEPLTAPPPAAAPAIPGLPPDETWPADQPTLDSIASLQARLIQVLNAELAAKGIKAGSGATLDPPDPSAQTPEAKLIDLQRRILALQRRLLESAGK